MGNDLRELRGRQVFKVTYMPVYTTRETVWFIDAESGHRLNGWTGPSLASQSIHDAIRAAEHGEEDLFSDP